MKAKAQIRIIAGSLKGRRIAGPDWPGLRPTSDRLRESLFNVLAGSVAGARVLDGFAGTGAVGIEALSRGAAHVTFVEQDPRALGLIGENLTRCGVTGGYTILRADMATARLPAVFDLIFLDPPYVDDARRGRRGRGERDGPRRSVGVEHARRSVPAASIAGLALTRTLTAGDSALSFYRHETPSSASA